jgi:hypothetical protein
VRVACLFAHKRPVQLDYRRLYRVFSGGRRLFFQSLAF